VEAVNADLSGFYEQLLTCMRHSAVQGDWQLPEARAAWDGNGTWDGFIGFAWHVPNQTGLIVAVNYAPNQGQCYLAIPPDQVKGNNVRLQDLMSSAVYDRDGDEVASRGLFLDLPPWGYNVFEMTTQQKSDR
jgi:hypothetical protein